MRAMPESTYVDARAIPSARPRLFPSISPRWLLKTALVFAAYFAAGKIGLRVPFASADVSPVWLAAGIGLGALLLFGYSVWPAIALGAFVVNFFSPVPHAAAVVITLGNVAGPLTGAWLLRRVAGFGLTELRQRHRETERREALERVTLLSRAVEQTADSVVITDKRGIIQYVNPAFEITTGYTRKEALGQTPRILKSGQHDGSFYKDLWGQVLQGQTFRGTLVNRKKGGQLYWAEQTITPIKDGAGNITHFVSVLKDITELRKKQEQEVQLRLAREVQQQFYTSTMSVRGFDIAAAAYPANETGGDYFDFIPMPDGSFYIAIGDASGHGFGSALIMALTRAYLRSFASVDLDVAEILTRVNHMLLTDLEANRFVTLLLVRLDPANGSLRYASAGHVPGILLNGEGEVATLLTSTGPPLALFPCPNITSATTSLKPGQFLFLGTDGALDATAADGSQCGAERIIEYLRAHRLDPARRMAEGVYEVARRFAGDERQYDDITSVVIKLEHPSPDPHAADPQIGILNS